VIHGFIEKASSIILKIFASNLQIYPIIKNKSFVPEQACITVLFDELVNNSALTTTRSACACQPSSGMPGNRRSEILAQDIRVRMLRQEKRPVAWSHRLSQQKNTPRVFLQKNRQCRVIGCCCNKVSQRIRSHELPPDGNLRYFLSFCCLIYVETKTKPAMKGEKK